MSAPRCPRRGCRMALVDSLDAIGRVSFTCPGCARTKAKLCRDCPEAIKTKGAMRCDRCRLARTRQRQADSKRRRYREDPAFRARHLAQHKRCDDKPERRERVRAYIREYSRAHRRPRDDADRAYFAAWQRQARQDPEFRARVNARRRELARLRRQEIAA